MPHEIDLYLCDIPDAIKNIQEYTSGFTYDNFISSRMCVDAVIKNFLIIGEAVKKIPAEMKSEHDFHRLEKYSRTA